MGSASLSAPGPFDGTHTQRLSTLATIREDGEFALDLGVDGVKCARCIAAIEGALAREPGVTIGRVNFSTHRLSLKWTGAQDLGDRLIAVVEGLGYKVRPLAESALKEASSEERRLLRALAVAGFATGNIMLLSVAVWSGFGAEMGLATKNFLHLIAMLVALPTLAYSGRIFFASAIGALKHGRTNMDVPISLALLLATLMSLYELNTGGEHVYFDSAVMLMFFLLIGRYLDAQARGKARGSAAALLATFTGTAQVLGEDGGEQTLPIRDLEPGMRVRLLSGDKIPADGILEDGRLDVDESLVTGESVPVARDIGDPLLAGAVLVSGSAVMRVAKPSEDSLLADIIRLMEVAEQGHSRYVRLADRAAALYTPVVHTVALAAFLLWWLGFGAAWQQSLLVAVSVLIITCPCALGLAVPVVQVLATSQLMRRGVLIKSGDALERLARVKHMAFDKTGTLTEGKLTLRQGAWCEDDLSLAAGLARHSRHMLCRALVVAAPKAAPNATTNLTEIEEIAGAGLVARLGEVEVRLGSLKHVGGAEPLRDDAPEVWLRVGAGQPVRFTFTDQARADAAETLAHLKASGIGVSLLSGDKAGVARDIGASVGIEDIRAPLSPPEKVQALKALAADSGVLMVGDGLNDAPALSAANVSMAPSTAVDISQQSADIVFQGSQLGPVRSAWITARHATRLVKENFAIAALYNLIAIPLAVAGYVTPLVAALAMSGSSIVVILNALRLGGQVKRTESAS